MQFSNIKFIYFFQLSAVLLTAFGVLPPETSLVLTAILIGYIFISPVEDSLLLVVASIPLYVALPLTENFDYMANWRLVILAVFFKWLLAKHSETVYALLRKVFEPERAWCRSAAETSEGENLSEISSLGKLSVFSCKAQTVSPVFIYTLCFAIFALISLIGAPYPIAGIKKIIFLANIFLLFILVKNIANTNEKIISLMKAVGLSAGITLAIGYLQFISVFFYSLYEFWQYWAQNIITVFYGHNLGELLSVSNAWFSYYKDLPPTLRMFSVFPDSHSFALFVIISLPILLTMSVYKINFFKNLRGNSLTEEIFIAAILLLPIIFSGSRGAWVSALAALAVGIFCFFKISKSFKSAVLMLLIFFILFPASSLLLRESQKAELRRLNQDVAKTEYVNTSFSRFASVVDADETSNRGRLDIWRDTLMSIKENPFFGVGFGNFPIILSQDISDAKKGSSAHNIYLDIWAEIGIFGLIFFLLIFYEIAKIAFILEVRSESKVFKNLSVMLFICLIWTLAYGFFDVVFFNDKVLLLFMSVIGILFAIKNQNLL